MVNCQDSAPGKKQIKEAEIRETDLKLQVERP